VLAAALAMATPAAASGTVVKGGYLTLPDGTQLRYTLTLPSATGRFPVILEYDPYVSGVTSNTDFAPNGYAFLGVNFRGTGCSTGTFQPLRGDIWGRDGATVVDWASRQPWSDGNIGMFGGSFTGTSQLATAEYAGPALKAIMPWQVFPDLYRSLVYPGGIFNSWIAGWVNGGRQFVLGTSNFEQLPNDPQCAVGEAEQTPPNESRGADVALHPYNDSFWATEPATLSDRIRVPVLGCSTWQDTTVHSYAFNFFRTLDPRLSWLVGGDGTHYDCPISHSLAVRFLNRYLRHENNGWDLTPHVVLAHEVPTDPPAAGGLAPDNAAKWTTAFHTWSDMDRAIQPVRLHLRGGGQLSLRRSSQGAAFDSYAYGGPTDNTPKDWTNNVSSWNNPAVSGRKVTYTTPVLSYDAEFLGSGSANLWLAAGAPEGDVQVTLSEIRPDGQEEYVESGWLRLSERRLDPRLSTELDPVPTYLHGDVAPLMSFKPVYARIQLLPFNHVFRAGSAIRLTIDTPGGWFAADPVGTRMEIFHARTMDSTLVLGRVTGGVAYAPLPPCADVLNQPCRPATGATVPGTLDLRSPG
jgi:putative CocE/NonD family hydrolase